MTQWEQSANNPRKHKRTQHAFELLGGQEAQHFMIATPHLVPRLTSCTQLFFRPNHDFSYGSGQTLVLDTTEPTMGPSMAYHLGTAYNLQDENMRPTTIGEIHVARGPPSNPAKRKRRDPSDEDNMDSYESLS